MWFINISKNFIDTETVIKPNEVSFTQSINDVDTLNFTIPTTADGVEYLDKAKKIKLFHIGENGDEFYFTGVIFNITWRVGGFYNVFCVDEKGHLANNKRQFNTYNFTPDNFPPGAPPKTLDFFISAVVQELNNRESEDRGFYSYEFENLDLSNYPIYIRIETGYDIKSVIDMLCSQANCEWHIVNNKIYIVNSVGTDRTLPNREFFQFYYSVKTPPQNNCILTGASLDLGDVATSIIAKTNGKTEFFNGDKSRFGSIEKDVFLPGSIIDGLAEKELEKRGADNPYYELTPTVETLNAFQVGDKIKLLVELEDAKFNFDEGIRVIQKIVNIEFGQTTNTTIQLSTNIEKLKYSGVNTFRLMNDKIRNLENVIANPN